MNRIFWFLSLCVVGLMPLALSAADAPSISNLKQNEVLEVQLTQTGCFHFSMSFYQFKAGQVTIYEMQESAPKEGEEQSNAKKYTKQKVGVLALSDKDITRIDNLFKYYASDASTGCTSIDNLAIKHLRDGKLIKSYAYEDASCNTYGKEHLLTLPTLLERLHALQQKQQQLKKPEQEAKDPKEK